MGLMGRVRCVASDTSSCPIIIPLAKVFFSRPPPPADSGGLSYQSPTDLLCEDVVLGMLRGQGECGGRGMRGARVLMDRDGDALKTFDPGPLKKGGKKRKKKKKPPSLSLPRDCEKRRSPSSMSTRCYERGLGPQEGKKILREGDFFI